LLTGQQTVTEVPEAVTSLKTCQLSPVAIQVLKAAIADVVQKPYGDRDMLKQIINTLDVTACLMHQHSVRSLRRRPNILTCPLSTNFCSLKLGHGGMPDTRFGTFEEGRNIDNG
jgi:hypothetical protein